MKKEDMSVRGWDERIDEMVYGDFEIIFNQYDLLMFPTEFYDKRGYPIYKEDIVEVKRENIEDTDCINSDFGKIFNENEDIEKALIWFFEGVYNCIDYVIWFIKEDGSYFRSYEYWNDEEIENDWIFMEISNSRWFLRYLQKSRVMKIIGNSYKNENLIVETVKKRVEEEMAEFEEEERDKIIKEGRENENNY